MWVALLVAIGALAAEGENTEITTVKTIQDSNAFFEVTGWVERETITSCSEERGGGSQSRAAKPRATGRIRARELPAIARRGPLPPVGITAIHLVESMAGARKMFRGLSEEGDEPVWRNSVRDLAGILPTPATGDPPEGAYGE